MPTTMYPKEPIVGSRTIWGQADYVDVWIPGRVVFVGTPSHGGFWVHEEIWNELAPDLRAFAFKWGHGEPGWFEEDSTAWKLLEARPDLMALHEERQGI